MGLSIKFYLESKAEGNDNKNRDSVRDTKEWQQKMFPIFLYVRRRGDKIIKVYTERKCNWHAWDPKKFRANAKKFSGAIELNGFLSDIEEEVANKFNYNSRKGILTSKDDIIRTIAELNGSGLKQYGFIEFAQEYVDKSTFAPNTKKGYQQTINALKEYSLKKRRLLDFNSIDLNFYDNYTTFLWKKGLNDNTVGTHIKHIKSVMNEGFERDLHSNMKYKKKGFLVLRKDSDSIYLSESEIEKLMAVDLSNDEKLERVRDVFCADCWLGLRYSDLIRVTKDKIVEEDGVTLFKIEMEKTGEVVRIPISPRARPLLEKYDYNLPVISSQKFNEYLKVIGGKAKINNQIEVTTMKAGKKVRKTFSKFDLITSHTARRSFATNLYLQGVQSQYIMAVTGHKTEKSFRAYLRLSDMQKVKEIDRHFKKQGDLKLAM